MGNGQTSQSQEEQPRCGSPDSSPTLTRRNDSPNQPSASDGDGMTSSPTLPLLSPPSTSTDQPSHSPPTGPPMDSERSDQAKASGDAPTYSPPVADKPSTNSPILPPSSSSDQPSHPLTSRELSNSDLPVLLTVLGNAAHCSEQLGYKLLPSDLVLTLQREANGDLVSLLIKVLTVRLQVLPALTVQELADAISQPPINNGALAQKLKNHYLNASRATTSAASTIPGGANITGSASIPTGSASVPTGSASVPTGSASPPGSASVSDSASQSQSVENESTEDEVRHKPHPRPFGCGCGNCTLERYLRGDCPTPRQSKTNFQYLDTKGLSESQREIFIGNLEWETDKIALEFQRLVSSTWRSFKERKIAPQMVVAHLGSLKVFSNVYKPDQILGSNFEQLRDAQTYVKVFDIIQDYMSFINPDLLEELIQELGDSRDKERFQKYQEKLNVFCNRLVVECPPQFASPSNGVQVLVKKDTLLQSFTVKELRKFQSKLSNIFQLPSYALQLCTVEEGCVRMTFHLPAAVADQLFPLSPEQEE